MTKIQTNHYRNDDEKRKLSDIGEVGFQYLTKKVIMPPRIRLIGRYGNALAILLFAALTLVGLSRGPEGFAILMLALGALECFNLYALEQAARLLSEEEWLKSEVRKAELRQRLRSLGSDAVGSGAELPPGTTNKSN